MSLNRKNECRSVENQDRETIRQLKLDRIVKLLRRELSSIPDVKTWAFQAGVSTSWLLYSVKSEYNVTPKVFLKNLRFKHISDHIIEDFEITGYELALETGLADEVALSKFLRRHFDTSLVKLKCKLHS